MNRQTEFKSWSWVGFGKLLTLGTGLLVLFLAEASGQAQTNLQTGRVVAWGDNDHGQTNVPARLNEVIGIAAGWWHSLALKSDGTVVAWGDNTYGECAVPADLGDVVAIAAGVYNSLALKSDGTLVAWGNNQNGQTNIPIGLNDVTAIAAGGDHCLALKSDGTVVAWGFNPFGQTTVPASLKDVIAIATGGDHCLALKSDGTVVAWGAGTISTGSWPNYGQSMVPADLHDVIAIAAGDLNSLAIKSNGIVVAWGYNGDGQSTVPANLSNAVAVAGGTFHSVAVKSDGTVVGWGGNWDGQANVPVGLTNVIAIGAGYHHNLALVKEFLYVSSTSNSQTAEQGSDVRFELDADGFPPPDYLWILNQTNFVACGTNCWSELTNCQFSQSGTYTVVVSNAFGAVTSAPFMLNVIPSVERRPVPGVKVMGEIGSSLNVEHTESLGPAPNWLPLDTVTLTNPPQYWFDVSTPLPPERFYRALQTGAPAVVPSLNLNSVPAVTLTGNIGDKLRLDCINQIGPTDAWVTLDTITLTNTSQLYFDTSAVGQPARLYRIVPVP